MREHLEPDVSGAFVYAPPGRQPVDDQQSTARRRVGSGLAHFVLEAPVGINDLAPHISGLDLKAQSDRALPVHDGIGHQLADHQMEIMQNVFAQDAGEPIDVEAARHARRAEGSKIGIPREATVSRGPAECGLRPRKRRSARPGRRTG